LGGYIVEVDNKPDETILTILQTPLDFLNEPKERDQSQGRFLIRSNRFLDPEIYRKDRKITVVGRVSGVEVRRLGERVYSYPIIESQALHLWPIRSYWPYYPYSYYPYSWYPWSWRRPYWYW
jgi:outer membrane lipoprotein